MKESGRADNTSLNAIIENQKSKLLNLIYCFICGIAYKSSSFLPHYLECKKSFEQTLLGKERPIVEHPNFLSLTHKLITREDYSSELEAYNQICEDQYFNLFAKECPKCHEMFMPEAYLKHSEKCQVRSRFNTSEFEHFSNFDLKTDCNNEKKQKMKRKTSMDNLKSLTKDELKGYKKFNIKHIKDRDEEDK